MTSKSTVSAIKGRFPPGVSGNPKGRPVGSKNKTHSYDIARDAERTQHRLMLSTAAKSGDIFSAGILLLIDALTTHKET